MTKLRAVERMEHQKRLFVCILAKKEQQIRLYSPIRFDISNNTHLGIVYVMGLL